MYVYAHISLSNYTPLQLLRFGAHIALTLLSFANHQVCYLVMELLILMTSFIVSLLPVATGYSVLMIPAFGGSSHGLYYGHMAKALQIHNLTVKIVSSPSFTVPEVVKNTGIEF